MYVIMRCFCTDTEDVMKVSKVQGRTTIARSPRCYSTVPRYVCIVIRATLLEATKRIIVDIIVQACRPYGSLACTVAPLATAAMSGSPRLCVQSLALNGITQGVVDECFHTNSTHSVEEVIAG